MAGKLLAQVGAGKGCDMQQARSTASVGAGKPCFSLELRLNSCRTIRSMGLDPETPHSRRESSPRRSSIRLETSIVPFHPAIAHQFATAMFKLRVANTTAFVGFCGLAPAPSIAGAGSTLVWKRLLEPISLRLRMKGAQHQANNFQRHLPRS